MFLSHIDVSLPFFPPLCRINQRGKKNFLMQGGTSVVLDIFSQERTYMNYYTNCSVRKTLIKKQ